MQVPSTAPRLGLVLLPGVLLLLVSAAAGTQRDDGQALDASSPQATRVAQTALSYLNYKQGSPSALRTLGYVTKAFVKVRKRKHRGAESFRCAPSQAYGAGG